jgi:tellurite resistance protein
MTMILADSSFVPCIVVLVIIVGLWVLGSLVGDRSGGAGAATGGRQSEQGLSVSVEPDTVLTDDGESFEIMRVLVSGTITVPHDGYQSMWHVWLSDITEDVNSPQPVICMIPDVADENGCFAIEERLRVPHACSELEGMEVATVPAFALVCPRRGTRRLRVSVTVTAATDPDRVWSAGSKTIEHHEPKVGYLEYERHSREQDERVARLAVAVALADGRFDKAEARVIRRHFFQRYAGETDEAQRKVSISRVMKETLRGLNEGGERVGRMIGRMAREMQDEDDLNDKRDAYELCVQIVGADGEVTHRELKSIDHIAGKLELPQAVVQEVHDRHLRVSMIREEAFDPLSMPAELSKPEKLKWLAEEYRRWHPRQNHQDPDVRQEAESRIELIAKRRMKVRDGDG